MAVTGTMTTGTMTTERAADRQALTELLQAPASQRLFVYGTLMTTAVGSYGQVARTRLMAECGPLRLPATTRGRLYELGQYPGMAASTGPDDVVHGELLLLSDPAKTLPWLDEYEMISTDPHADNEYVRDMHEVTIHGGQSIRAMTYLYVKPILGLTRVTSGRWRA